MSSERYMFDRPEKVSWLMGDLFPLYVSYASDSFPFEWLQKTEDLEVRCKDATSEKIAFPTSPELLKAIRGCERVTHPEKRRGLPNNWGFSGFMRTAVHQVLNKVPFVKAEELSGPLFERIYLMIIKSYPRITGVHVFHLQPNHWSCMMRDHSSAFDPRQESEDCKSYLLRSELLTVFSIFYRQMNEVTWDAERERFKAKFIYKGGFLMHTEATVVTFIYGQVRIVQATLDPSEKYPTLNFTLRAIYDLSEESYDREVAYTILKWILSPPEPVEEVKKA